MTEDRFHQFHQAVYVISVAAELAGVHPQTLRVYERRGLLAPARTAGGSRRYSDADLALLGRIAELTEEGLNLAGVQRVLELERVVEELQHKLAEVRRARERDRDEVRRAHERDRAELAARGFGAGSLVPAVRPKSPVTLYRARRDPAAGADARRGR